MSKFPTKIEATPKMVAEAFWNLDDAEQAQFFAELYDLTQGHLLGETQWYYMSQRIEEIPKAKEQACAMMVWIFNRATDFLRRSPA